jgi:predicted RNase H-like nuclease (RuvC/YqgF family)
LPSDALAFNANFQLEYKNNLITLSAQKAELKNVLLRIADETGIYVRFPNSLKKQITIEISDVSLSKTLSKILKGMNHAVIYSGSRRNQAVVSDVFIYMASKKYKVSSRSTSREKKIAAQIRSYEKRLKILKEKLSQFDKHGRQGRRYLRRIRHYENIIENLQKKIR